MLSQDKANMLVALLDMRDNGPKDVFYGICSNFKDYNQTYTVETENFLHETFKKWPEFSGYVEYPIGAKSNCSSLFNYTQNLWDTETEYGQARYRLLDFLIQTLVDEDRKA